MNVRKRNGPGLAAILIALSTALAAGEGPVLEKLCERPLRVEGRPVSAGKLILLPCGIRLVALDAQTGREVWSYLFEEDRAGLRAGVELRVVRERGVGRCTTVPLPDAARLGLGVVRAGIGCGWDRCGSRVSMKREVL